MTEITAQSLRWKKIILVAATLCGLLGIFTFPSVPAALGVSELGMRFVDTHALLAASDAANAGVDPFRPHRFDIFGRPHVYSSWWLHVLMPSGLTRNDTLPVGYLVVAVFVIVALIPLSPRSPAELLWQLSLLLSPPLLLAVNRANNDLVIFSLIGTALLLVRSGQGARPFWLIGATAVATGLKFYPFAAAISLSVLRPASRAWRLTLLALAAAAAALLAVAGDLHRAMIPSPEGLFVFGAKVAWLKFGAQQRLLTAASSAAACLVGGWLALQLNRTDRPAPADPGLEKQNLYFATGVSLILGSFFAGASYGYRWVFALWIAPWIWTKATAQPATPGLQRKLARACCVLLPASLWFDGLYCAVVNLLAGPIDPQRELLWEQRWISLTQLPVWILMTLFAALFGSLVLSSAHRGQPRNC